LHSIKKYRGMLKTFFLEEETIQAVAGEREFSNFYVNRPRKTSALCSKRRSRFYKPKYNGDKLVLQQVRLQLNSVLSYFGTELFVFRVISFLLLIL